MLYCLCFLVLWFSASASSSCDNSNLSCKTATGQYGTCVNNTCQIVEAEVRGNLRFTIVVKYPETTLKVNDAVSVHYIIYSEALYYILRSFR